MKTTTLNASILVAISTIAAIIVLRSHSFGQEFKAHGSSIAHSDAPSSNAILVGLVYRDLVTSHSKGNEGTFYGAYFVETTRENAAYLGDLFSNSVPRIELGTNSLVITDSGIIDKVTRKPGKLFWARVQSVSNNIAEIKAGWYSTPQAAGNILYRLKWTGTNWMIFNRITEGTS